MFDRFGINAGYVEELHTRWQQSPQSVDEDWRRFFEGDGLVSVSLDAPTNGVNGKAAARLVLDAQPGEAQSRVAHLVNAYRVRGHLVADLDPLDATPLPVREIALASVGLTESDLDQSFSTAG